VMMAHQLGVTHVVATMGTALNEAHVRQLRRFVPKVTLVFDADAGGVTGVDRALEIFVGCDVELAIATLPEGLDPFDFLVAQGAEPFQRALGEAVNALDFKLSQLLTKSGDSLDGAKRVVDAILSVMALSPETQGQAGQVKQELLITRLSQRLGLRQETVWARFAELRQAKKKETTRTPQVATPSIESPAVEERRAKPAKPIEKELLQILLAEPALIGEASTQIFPEEIEHPGLQQLLGGLYRLFGLGQPPTVDGLREVVNHAALIEWALENQEIGRMAPDKGAWLKDVLTRFRMDRKELVKKKLMDRLRAAKTENERLDVLREIQDLDRNPEVRAPE